MHLLQGAGSTSTVERDPQYRNLASGEYHQKQLSSPFAAEQVRSSTRLRARLLYKFIDLSERPALTAGQARHLRLSSCYGTFHRKPDPETAMRHLTTATSGVSAT